VHSKAAEKIRKKLMEQVRVTAVTIVLVVVFLYFVLL